MSGVTMPGYSYQPYPMPPQPPRRKPRWWMVTLASAWAVVIVVTAIWSVRHDPPSVPDQRTVADALPYLQNATAAALAAADAPDRAVVLGPLTTETGCRITPVRKGVLATRDVTVHVRADQLAPAFDAIAQRLPKEFHAEAAHTVQNTRHDLFADAGGFVSVSATAHADDTVFTIRASTGCRPGANFTSAPSVPGNPPVAFGSALAALKGSPAGVTETTVSCPGGGAGSTFLSSAFAASGDLGSALQKLAPTFAIVESDPHSWAYRVGDVSIVASGPSGSVRVSATTACH